MARLSKQQVETITGELEEREITFEPLRAELFDHLLCDVEWRMEQGSSFEDSWTEVKNHIPKNHLKDIQLNTMEILGKKHNYIKIIAMISFGLLALATLFKTLHLPGAGLLLMIYLIGACITLILEFTKTILVYRESRGRWAIILVGISILALVVGQCFKLLHLWGADFLLYFSAISMTLVFPLLSVYFYRSGKALKDHLIIHLIQDNQKVMENIALFLIGFGLVINYPSLLAGKENFVGIIFFIFSIILIGAYVFSLTWINYVSNEKAKSANLWLLISSSIAFILFMLPLLGWGIGPVLRNISAFGSLVLFILIVLVYYIKYSDSSNKVILSSTTFVLLLYPVMRFGTNLKILGEPLNGLTTNPTFVLGFLGLLLILLLAFRKEQ